MHNAQSIFKRWIACCAFFVSFFVVPAHAQGDVYSSLEQARKEGKLLIVEFHAPWNYKSIWFHDHILGNQGVKKLIGDNFILHTVDTGQESGAALAQQYSVADYPNIVIFNASGNVIGAVDRTMEASDFEERLRQAILSTDGRSSWLYEQITSAATHADKELTQRKLAEYLTSKKPSYFINTTHWALFEFDAVNYYQSTGYNFLLAHHREFITVSDTATVHNVLERIFDDVTTTYIIGNEAFDSIAISTLQADIAKVDFNEQVLERLANNIALARYRAEGDINNYLTMLRVVLGSAQQQNRFPLVLSLDFVAINGDKAQRKSAKTIIGQQLGSSMSAVQTSILEGLIVKLSDND